METLTPVKKSEVEALRFLIQLYRHDLSEFRGCRLAQDYRFYEGSLVENHLQGQSEASLIRDSRGIAGFIIIEKDDNRAKPWTLADFFVLRASRKQGVGFRAAQICLDQASSWTLSVDTNNLPALKFWARVLDSCSMKILRQERVDPPHSPVSCIRYLTQQHSDKTVASRAY